MNNKSKNDTLFSIDQRATSLWHPSKNGDITPRYVKPNSTKEFWWLCEEGHEWQSKVSYVHRRTKKDPKAGCPTCGIKKRAKTRVRNHIEKNGSLMDHHPMIAKEWHPTKNKGIKPNEVSKGSSMVVWWMCEKKHEWKTKVAKRTIDGYCCPYCSGSRLTFEKSLQFVSPSLAKEWHPTKNKDLLPKHVHSKSNRKVWWICKNKHEWQAVIDSRYRNGCPKCGGKKASEDHNLYKAYPEVAAEWHPIKNNNLQPTDFTPKSHKKVWWQCIKGHEWDATISNRTNGRGCPKCRVGKQTSFPEHAILYYLKKYIDGIKSIYYISKRFSVDLFLKNLNVAIEYDGEYAHKKKKKIINDINKNEYLKGNEIPLIRVRENGLPSIKSYGSFVIEREDNYSYKSLDKVIKLIFKYLNNMKDLELPLDIVNTERDRIKIYEQMLVYEVKNSFGVKYPDISKEWNYEKNGKLTPFNFSYGSGFKAWWICKCGHEWEQVIKDRGRGQGCPYCSNTKVFKDNCLEIQNPKLSEEWHLTKNQFKPKDVTPGSTKKVWWLCENGHEWEAAVYSRSSGNGCPYCSGRKVCKDNCLSTVNSKLSMEWHPTKNQINPKDVTSGSGKKVWWLCKKGHEWQATVNSRNRGNGCLQCASQ